MSIEGEKYVTPKHLAKCYLLYVRKYVLNEVICSFREEVRKQNFTIKCW